MRSRESARSVRVSRADFRPHRVGRLHIQRSRGSRFHGSRVLHMDRGQTITGEARDGNFGSIRGTNRLTGQDIPVGIRLYGALLPGVRRHVAGIEGSGAHLNPAFSAGTAAAARCGQDDPRLYQIGVQYHPGGGGRNLYNRFVFVHGASSRLCGCGLPCFAEVRHTGDRLLRGFPYIGGASVCHTRIFLISSA